MKTIVRDGGDCENLWFFGGGVHSWKLTSGETHGGVGMFEDALERGKVTPLHTHPESDEILYVLDGEILVHADGSPRAVGRGGVVIHPRGVPHALVVTSERARLLVILAPGAQTEGFYRLASTPGESGPVDFEKIGRAAQQTGATVILGPPPFSRP